MLFWHVPAPNEALLISGSKRLKDATQFRIVTGHGSFVMPVKQKARVLSLALVTSTTWPRRTPPPWPARPASPRPRRTPRQRKGNWRRRP
jgi:hypothetical protein